MHAVWKQVWFLCNFGIEAAKMKEKKNIHRRLQSNLFHFWKKMRITSVRVFTNLSIEKGLLRRKEGRREEVRRIGIGLAATSNAARAVIPPLFLSSGSGAFCPLQICFDSRLWCFDCFVRGLATHHLFSLVPTGLPTNQLVTREEGAKAPVAYGRRGTPTCTYRTRHSSGSTNRGRCHSQHLAFCSASRTSTSSSRKTPRQQRGEKERFF